MIKEKIIEVEFMHVWDKWAWRFTKFEFPEEKKTIKEEENFLTKVKADWEHSFFISDSGGDATWEEVCDWELLDKVVKEKLSAFVDFVNEKYGKKKRWRAEKGENYFYISANGRINSSFDTHRGFDNERYNFGSYFRTKEEAEVYAEKIRKMLEENK